ncbi:MAG: hypothetical protein IT165_07345 [Bryobacterales bacterium]|nr:hypothetical protein [Bryobacterales bacterium]
MTVSLPVDALEYRGASNGGFTSGVYVRVDKVAPGSFVAVNMTGQFADGRMSFVCGMIPDLAQLWLRIGDGPERFIRLRSLPEGMATGAPPRCQPLGARIPLDTEPGSATLRFYYPGVNPVNGSVDVNLVRSRVSVFTPPVRMAEPLRPGASVTIMTTGLGLVAAGDLQLVIGEQTVPASYLERDVFGEGFDAVDFRIPDPAPESCYVPVFLRVRDIGETRAMFLPMAKEGVCAHPWGLGEDSLRTLDEHGRIRIGHPSIDLFFSESLMRATARFELADADRVLYLVNPEEQRSCRIRLSGAPVVLPAFNAAVLGDAGQQLSLQAPSGEERLLTAKDRSYSVSSGIPENPAGEWRLQAPGGEDIAPFETAVTIPALPAWSPPDLVTLNEDLKIEYSLDAVDAGERVAVVIQPRMSGDYLECRTESPTGQVTIPSRYLRLLAGSADGIIGLVVTRPVSGRTLFPLPLADGATAMGVFDYRVISIHDVRYQ